MYVRVKRKRTTFFLHVEPNETVLELKQKLQELTEQVRTQTWLRGAAPSRGLRRRRGKPHLFFYALRCAAAARSLPSLISFFLSISRTTQCPNGSPQPPEAQMLYKDGAGLEDARRLAEYRIENDDVLGLALALPGACMAFCFGSLPYPFFGASRICFACLCLRLIDTCCSRAVLPLLFLFLPPNNRRGGRGL